MPRELGSHVGQGGPSRPGISVSDVDFVTALCSQVVYEGLVDDTFRVKCGKWHLGEAGGGGEVLSSRGALAGGRACGRASDSEQTAGFQIVWGTPSGSSGKGRGGKPSLEILIAAPSALKGSVDFGPEVTSSDRSLKVLLNAEDKVRVRGCWLVGRPWATLGGTLGGEAEPGGGAPPPAKSEPRSMIAGA